MYVCMYMYPNNIYIYILIIAIIEKKNIYRAGDRSCLLCMEEKLAITSCKSRDMLNQRSEVLNSCRHKGRGCSIIRDRFRRI